MKTSFCFTLKFHVESQVIYSHNVLIKLYSQINPLFCDFRAVSLLFVPICRFLDCAEFFRLNSKLEDHLTKSSSAINYFTTNGDLWPEVNITTGKIKRFRYQNSVYVILSNLGCWQQRVRRTLALGIFKGFCYF